MTPAMRKTYIGIGILAIIIGLMMLIVPHQCIKAIVIILGVFSVANGVYNLFAIRRLIADSDFAITITIRGIISIIVGLLAILLPLIFAGVIWTIMVYILAFYLLKPSLQYLPECQNPNNLFHILDTHQQNPHLQKYL